MMTQHMPNFEEMFRMKWLWVIEEDGERSFRSYNQFTTNVGRQTDLLGYRDHEARQAILHDSLHYHGLCVSSCVCVCEFCVCMSVHKL